MLQGVKPHLVELRKRIFISALALIVGFVVSFIAYKPILSWVTAPLDTALAQIHKKVHKTKDGRWSISNKDSNISINNDTNRTVTIMDNAIINADTVINSTSSSKTEKLLAKSIKKIATQAKEQAKKLNEIDNSTLWGSTTTNQIGGVFVVAVKVSLYTAIFLALPIILWQFWLFVAPGLYDNEKKMALPFLIGTTVMFAVGVLFAYYVVTPFGFQFLITFGAFLYTPLINIEDYIGFFAKILFGFGLAFELPMIVYFLASIKLITEKTLLDVFRYAIVIIFIVAALLTPPDVVTQMLMAAPLIMLYGVSIIVAKIINPYKPDSDEEDTEDEENDTKSEQKQIEHE